MLQALVITLREGVEAALIVGIVLAYLSKIGRPELRRLVFIALGSAAAASVALAVVLARLDMAPELFEGTVMLVAAFFVVTMIWFMSRAARTLKGDIERRVGAFSSTGSHIGLFLFVFLMVLREGVETVLVLAAVQFTSSHLLSFLGTLAGIALSIVFGVMFVGGSVRVPLQKFFRVTTVILVFVAVQLTISGLHELSEGGYLPSNKRIMATIGPVVRNDVFFFITMLALAGLMVLFEARQRAAEDTASLSGAERRKVLWTQRKERLWSAGVYVSSFLFIVLVTAEFIYAKAASGLSPATEVAFVSGKVVVSAAGIQEGQLRRYTAQLNGQPVRFLIYKKMDGHLVTVMDACAICGSVGFYSNGPQGLICKNCSAPINPQSVGDAGGCNPIPLVSRIDGDTVTVSEMDLATGRSQIKD